jgi:polyhydroxybutyrate depolymerase
VVRMISPRSALVGDAPTRCRRGLAPLIVVCAQLLSLAAGQQQHQRPDFPFAKAELTAGLPRDTSDSGVLATVAFEQLGSSSVRVAYHIRGLAPGSIIRVRLHEAADLLTLGCVAAGARLGDLGSVVADGRGVATGVITTPELALAGESSIVGQAVVLLDAANATGVGGGRNESSAPAPPPDDWLACGVIVGAEHGCSATPSLQPIVGRQCQQVNVLGAWGTTSGMVLGRERESRAVCAYVPCRPAGYEYPLVVLLHDYGSNGTQQEMYERFAPMADELGFILALPDGTHEGNAGSGRRFWSATDACCNFGVRGSPELGGLEPLDGYQIDGRSRVDDSGFVRQVIEVIQTMYTVDARRIYATGRMNGGYMSHRLACDHSDLLAGVVSVGGSAFEGVVSGEYDLPATAEASGEYIDYKPDYSCSPSNPVHVLEVHGTADTVVPYNGGRPTGTKTLSAPMTLAVWAGLNNCDPDAFHVETLALDLVTPPHPDTDIHSATDCAAGGASELWTIRGAGNSPHWLTAANGATMMSRHAVEWLLARPKPTVGWAPTLAVLRDPNAAIGDWREAAMPMAIATKFSYTQTWGSYRGDQSEELAGWRLIRVVNPEDGPCASEPEEPCEVVDPVTGVQRGGMHALAFISADGGRLIFAFRGTDLDPSAVSGRADACSNSMRGGIAFDDLPRPRCAGFTFNQLDYVARARELVQGVLEEVGPVPDVMTTGHSLGSYLAAMMAVEFGFWSLSFGSGGVEQAVVDCDGLHGTCPTTTLADLCTPAEEPPVEQRLMVLNNPYDPLHYHATERGMMGWVCAWGGQFEEPASCQACYEADDQSQCGMCFAQTHIYAFYLNLVTTALNPPVCAQHSAMDLCGTYGPIANTTAVPTGPVGGSTPTAVDPEAALAVHTTDSEDVAGWPDGSTVGAIVGIGLAVCVVCGCCYVCMKSRRPKDNGYKPVTFEDE